MSDIRDRMLGTRPSDRRSDVASGVAGSCVKRNVAGAPDFLPSKSIWGSTLDIKKSSTAHSLHGYNYTTTFPPLGAVEDISAVGAGGLPASQTMVAPSLSPLPSECASKGQPQGPFLQRDLSWAAALRSAAEGRSGYGLPRCSGTGSSSSSSLSSASLVKSSHVPSAPFHPLTPEVASTPDLREVFHKKVLEKLKEPTALPALNRQESDQKPTHPPSHSLLFGEHSMLYVPSFPTRPLPSSFLPPLPLNSRTSASASPTLAACDHDNAVGRAWYWDANAPAFQPTSELETLTANPYSSLSLAACQHTTPCIVPRFPDARQSTNLFLCTPTEGEERTARAPGLYGWGFFQPQLSFVPNYVAWAGKGLLVGGADLYVAHIETSHHDLHSLGLLANDTPPVIFNLRGPHTPHRSSGVGLSWVHLERTGEQGLIGVSSLGLHYHTLDAHGGASTFASQLVSIPDPTDTVSAAACFFTRGRPRNWGLGTEKGWIYWVDDETMQLSGSVAPHDLPPAVGEAGVWTPYGGCPDAFTCGVGRDRCRGVEWPTSFDMPGGNFSDFNRLPLSFGTLGGNVILADDRVARAVSRLHVLEGPILGIARSDSDLVVVGGAQRLTSAEYTSLNRGFTLPQRTTFPLEQRGSLIQTLRCMAVTRNWKTQLGVIDIRMMRDTMAACKDIARSGVSGHDGWSPHDFQRFITTTYVPKSETLGTGPQEAAQLLDVKNHPQLSHLVLGLESSGQILSIELQSGRNFGVQCLITSHLPTAAALTIPVLFDVPSYAPVVPSNIVTLDTAGRLLSSRPDAAYPADPGPPCIWTTPPAGPFDCAGGEDILAASSYPYSTGSGPPARCNNTDIEKTSSATSPSNPLCTGLPHDWLAVRQLRPAAAETIRPSYTAPFHLPWLSPSEAVRPSCASPLEGLPSSCLPAGCHLLSSATVESTIQKPERLPRHVGNAFPPSSSVRITLPASAAREWAKMGPPAQYRWLPSDAALSIIKQHIHKHRGNHFGRWCDGSDIPILEFDPLRRALWKRNVDRLSLSAADALVQADAQCSALVTGPTAVCSDDEDNARTPKRPKTRALSENPLVHTSDASDCCDTSSFLALESRDKRISPAAVNRVTADSPRSVRYGEGQREPQQQQLRPYYGPRHRSLTPPIAAVAPQESDWTTCLPPCDQRALLYNAEAALALFNRAGPSGLEPSMRCPMVNAIVQVLRFIPELTTPVLKHHCERETCLACELGFLWHMLALATNEGNGRACQAKNFIFVLEKIPEARLCRILPQQRDNPTLAVPDELMSVVQAFLPFLLQQLRRDLRNSLATDETRCPVGSRNEICDIVAQLFGCTVRTTSLCLAQGHKTTSDLLTRFVVTLQTTSEGDKKNGRLSERQDDSEPQNVRSCPMKTFKFETALESSLARTFLRATFCKSCNTTTLQRHQETVTQIPPVLTLDCGNFNWEECSTKKLPHSIWLRQTETSVEVSLDPHDHTRSPTFSDWQAYELLASVCLVKEKIPLDMCPPVPESPKRDGSSRTTPVLGAYVSEVDYCPAHEPTRLHPQTVRYNDRRPRDVSPIIPDHLIAHIRVPEHHLTGRLLKRSYAARCSALLETATGARDEPSFSSAQQPPGPAVREHSPHTVSSGSLASSLPLDVGDDSGPHTKDTGSVGRDASLRESRQHSYFRDARDMQGSGRPVGKPESNAGHAAPVAPWVTVNDFVVTCTSEVEALTPWTEWKSVVCLFYVSTAIGQQTFAVTPDPARQDAAIVKATTIQSPIPASFVINNVNLSRHPLASSVPHFHPLSQEEIKKIMDSGYLLSFDTEFVLLNRPTDLRDDALALARLSVVRAEGPQQGLPCLDCHVLTKEEPVDYLTKFSGLKPGDLDETHSSHWLTTRKSLYQKLRFFLDHRCTFIGHGLSKDFHIVNLFVPESQLIDTAQLFRLPGRRILSLRFLASQLLGQHIQTSESGHDSVEDATVALQLYRRYQDLHAQGLLPTVLDYLYTLGDRTNWSTTVILPHELSSLPYPANHHSAVGVPSQPVSPSA